MHILETEIHIAASAQTVWSILDDIEKYPEWNPLIPEISGRTTVDQILQIKLVQPGMPDLQLTPHIIRIVGARELRWLTSLPDPTQLSGNHYFILSPTDDGGCHLQHNEEFTGSLVDSLWPALDTVARSAYNAMNQALKERSERFHAEQVLIHPAVDKGGSRNVESVSERELRCHCSVDAVVVTISQSIQHNHLCGCSKCWRPSGALFAQIAVVPAGAATVSAHQEKLQVVDPAQGIQRLACKECGVHMVGRVSNADHHFYGLEFVHPELGESAAHPMPEFAAFVSSLVETGTSPSMTSAIRKRLATLGIACFDTFSPELMDLIAWHKVKLSKI